MHTLKIRTHLKENEVKKAGYSSAERLSPKEQRTSGINRKLRNRAVAGSPKPPRPKKISSEKLIKTERSNRMGSHVNLKLMLRLDKPSIQINSSFLKKDPHKKYLSLSPIKGNPLLKIKKEAIHRPYADDDQLQIDYQEISVDRRNIYWRKKKLEQYRVAKNINHKAIGDKRGKNGASRKRNQSIEKIYAKNRKDNETRCSINKNLSENSRNLNKGYSQYEELVKIENKNEPIQIRINSPVSEKIYRSLYSIDERKALSPHLKRNLIQ